jgi:translation initiation factor IF-2
LEDAEVEKLKAYLAGGAKKPAAPPPSPVVVEPVRAAVASTTAVGEAPTTVLAPPVAEEPATYSRTDYMAPGTGGKVRVISTKAKSTPTDKKADGDEGAKRRKREPVISLAKLPDVKQPVNKGPAEPTPQKPEIRLPKDAIVGTRKGVKPKLDELVKTAEKGKFPLAGKGNLATKERPVEAGAAAPLSSKVGAKSRKPKGRDADIEEPKNPNLAGLASARADRQKARKSRQKDRPDAVATEEDSLQLRRRRTLSRRGTNTAAPRKGKVALELPCTVRSFSEAAGVSASQVQKALMGLGVMATINAKIADEHVEAIAQALGVELEFKPKESLEDSLLKEMGSTEETPESLQLVPPS